MKNNLAMIRQAVSAPWAIRPDYLPTLLANLERMAHHDAEPVVPEPIAVDDLVEGQIAVIPLRGVLLQHPGLYWGDSFTTYTEWWGDAFEELVRDPEVAGIVIDEDSPGGIVFGTQELSDRIYAARGTKPILTISNALSASAAYWIGTAADRVYVTPSGEVGSVGVYMMHTDLSKMLEEWGIDITFIHAGEFKVEANSFEPLSDEARAELQGYVDEAHESFINGLARNLGLDASRIRKEFGQGRTVTAEEAVRRGMAYGVAALDEVIAECAKLAGVSPVQALEGRGLASPTWEVREMPAAVGQGNAEWSLVGEGVTYGAESADMGGWREVFEPDAFAGSLGGDDVRVIWQHDPACVLGRVKAGTAHVWEDAGVLRYGANPPDAQWARDAMESIRRGDVDKSSFGFRALPGGVRWEKRDGYDLRIVSRAELVELGPQTFPAYQDTSVAVQERSAWQKSERARADAEFRLELQAVEAAL